MGGVDVLNESTFAKDRDHARLRGRHDCTVIICSQVRGRNVVPGLVCGPAVVDAGGLMLELGNGLLLGFRGEVVVENLSRVVNVDVVTLSEELISTGSRKEPEVPLSSRGNLPRVSSTRGTARWVADRRGCCLWGLRKKSRKC